MLGCGRSADFNLLSIMPLHEMSRHCVRVAGDVVLARYYGSHIGWPPCPIFGRYLTNFSWLLSVLFNLSIATRKGGESYKV